MKIYFSQIGKERCAVKRVLQCALRTLLQPSKQLQMSLSVVTEEEIRQLNNTFRQTDAVTDVLSFPAAELQKQIVDVQHADLQNINPQTGKFDLGDVVICRARALQQSEEYQHSFKREMCFLALHGLLHLLGYDHENQQDEEQMTLLQRQILQKAGVER